MKKTFIAPKVSMQKVAGVELIMSSTEPGLSSTPFDASAGVEAKPAGNSFQSNKFLLDL